MRKELILIIIILLGAYVFRLLTMGGVELKGYDENIYGIFVKTLGEKGIGGIRSLIRQYADDGILNKGPLPFRILYLFLGALVCKASGSYSLDNLAWISFVFGFGIIIVGYLIFKNWFSSKVAILATLLLATSPLGIGLSRRALQDSLFAFLVIVSFFFYHLYWRNQKKSNIFLFAIFVLASLLTKESTILLYPCFLIGALYYRKHNSRGSLMGIFTALIVASLIYLFINIWFAGDFKTYVKSYIAYSQMQGEINYVLQFQQGPWFRYIIDCILVSPLAYVFSIVGMVAYLPDKRDRDARNLIVLYTLSGLAIFSCLANFNLRFVLPFDVFLRALSVLGILFVADKVNKPVYRYVLAAGLIILVAGSDVYQFFQIFIKSNVYDPVTIALIKANGWVR